MSAGNTELGVGCNTKFIKGWRTRKLVLICHLIVQYVFIL